MIKKILSLFICFNIVSMPAYCTINDDFVEKTLPKETKIQKVKKIEIIDSFVEQTLDKNLKTKKTKSNNLVDTFAESNQNKNAYTKPDVNFYEQIVVTTNKKIEPKKTILITDSNSIPVQIRIRKQLSTKQKIDEGDYIEFETISDVKIKNKNYPKGTVIKARVETISQNKMWGVPSDLTVGNFNLDGQKLNGEINKTGANRSLWLYPTVYMTTFMFGAGLLLIPIRGGHAKIKPKQVFTVHYGY